MDSVHRQWRMFIGQCSFDSVHWRVFIGHLPFECLSLSPNSEEALMQSHRFNQPTKRSKAIHFHRNSANAASAAIVEVARTSRREVRIRIRTINGLSGHSIRILPIAICLTNRLVDKVDHNLWTTSIQTIYKTNGFRPSTEASNLMTANFLCSQQKLPNRTIHQKSSNQNVRVSVQLGTGSWFSSETGGIRQTKSQNDRT